MWQSRVEIEHYSVAYFASITAFEALLRETSPKGRTHICFVNVVSNHDFTQPALNRSSTLEHFEHSNVSKIRNRVMFDFYPVVPHV